MSQVAATRVFWDKAVLFSQTVRIEQTLFTLPFAYLTLFLVEGGLPDGATFGWITLAMAGARSFGMAANRLIDAEIDARNPRTAAREMPSGLLKHRDMLLFMALSMALFLVAVYRLSDWAGYTWPVAIAALTFYHYMKRFTWASHFGLGFIYGMVPTGVWVAATNELTWGPVLLGFGVGAWVSGFDVIYATQDIEFDRRHGLHSIPSRFGLTRALQAAKLFHLLTVTFIAAAGPVLDAGPLYYIGVAAFLLLLLYEHRLVSPQNLSGVKVAFFNMNSIISMVFFLFVITDVLIK